MPGLRNSACSSTLAEGAPGGANSGIAQSIVTPANALSNTARETPAAFASGQTSAAIHFWNAASTAERSTSASAAVATKTNAMTRARNRFDEFRRERMPNLDLSGQIRQ